MTTDIRRYLGLLLMFCVVDLIGFALGTHSKPIDFDRLSLAAALLTILWAVRDGQKEPKP